MAEKKKYNSILISGRKDQTLTYSKHVKDEESGESVKESLDKKVNITDELTTQQIKDGAITNEKMAADSVGNTNLQDGSVSNEKLEDGSITNEKLAENSITKDKLKDNTIGIEKLDPELRQTINAATGLPENLVETIQNVDDTLKDYQSQLDDKQQQITANDEDISLLQTRSTQMEETIKDIAATGGASQATAVTYNNEKSKLTAINIQSAVDEVVDKTAIKDEEGIVVETPFHYIQNEEFIFAKVDAEDKLLFGFRWDGTPVFGKTSAVEDRLQSQVSLLADKITTILGDDDTTSAIDTLKELKNFFASIDNTQTLTSILANLNNISTKLGEDIKNLQDTKVDKEEGKSLIENEVKERFRVIENEEFIMAVVDSEDRLIFGIYRATGKPYYPLNDMYHISHSEEFLWVILDTANHPLLGIQQDGTSWAAKAQWLDDIKAIKIVLSNIDETLKTLQPKEDGKGLINIDVAASFFYISNDEYIIAVVDAENRILAAIKYDAQPYFPNHEMYSVIANEEWLYAIIDAENKVLCGFRADDGHMVVGGIDISTFIANAIIDIADIKKRTAHLSTIENDEYLAVEQDAEGKVLSATNPDGSHYIHKVKSETILTQIEEKTDIENRLEMTLDEEEHILSYRDKNGVKHETALDVEHLDVEHFSMKGESIDFSNYATQDDVNGIELKNIDGVYDNSKPNLYLTSQKTYTTADGKQSFTPPNAGAEMSNKIPCKPGEWFTRTGTATGMVVVSDKNDNNAKRLMPNGSLPKASVQVPEYWDWAAYIRFAVATYENNVTINRGKYAVSESSDSVSIPKLKLNVANFTKETKYLKSPNGTFFELSVSDKGVLSVKEIDKDLVAPFDVPSDLKFTISNPSGGAAVFCGNANRVLLHNEKYLYEVKETGLTKFLSIADSSAYFYNVEHQVNSSGKSRIVALLKVDPFKGLCVFDENFILIDQLASPNYDTHDFIYIDDFHYIVYYHSNVLTMDGHMTYSDTLVEWKNGKKIGSYTLNDQDVLRDILFDADVHSTAPIAETHTNTIGFDRTEDRIIVNPRNCCSWIILKRTVSSEDKVTFGPVLEQVGGLPSSSNYGAVARRIKTDSLAQWFLCHDVKYWGMKEISGVSYPTYTLFDNNFLMKENPRNNPTSNPTGATDNAATCSRIVQLSIDWSKRKIVEYKVYVVPSYYSNVMSSAWMMDEGMFCIDYAIMGTIIFADFTTEATTVSEDNHLYTNAKITWKLKQQKLLYRANIY
jgi:hypothetical protein